jgi:23S rRNA (adenine2503-C2)-methyltransferase
MEKDLKSLSFEEITDIVTACGGKKFHAGYVFNFIHEKGAAGLDDITPIPKSLRQQLSEEGYSISSLTIAESYTDQDGTEKYVFETFDSYRIETVLLTDQGRNTLCISSQVGCRMGCGFCATARLGFRRDLTCAEIIDQVYQVTKTGKHISNVVYMGMGEPFDNYGNTILSARLLNHPKGLNIGARHITISTCGIPEKIAAFGGEPEQFRLAISLHAANNDDRTAIMPVNKKYPIAKMLSAVKTYNHLTGRRVTFEYCMIKDVNDSTPDAVDLTRLLKGVKCNINLIEYNEHPGSDLKASSRERIAEFQKLLTDKGFETHIRLKRGIDINAACGQLGLLGG